MIQASVDKQAGTACLEEKSLDAKWFALYTRSRHEKLLHRELAKKGIDSFLPLRKVMRHWSDRKKMIEEPLFKGYLFVRIPWTQRLDVLNSVGAVRFIGPRPSDPLEVPDKELEAIRRFVSEDIQVDPFPYLKAGEKVYVRSGPFKGAEGFVVRKDKHCRLVISLDMLMQSVSIQIDEACVEPA
jgi:transcription antitermination factor NusG